MHFHGPKSGRKAGEEKKARYEKRYPSRHLQNRYFQGLFSGPRLAWALLRINQRLDCLGRREGIPIDQTGNFQ